MSKYLDIVNGRTTQKSANTTSAGVSDANKLVALNGQGKIDDTMLPTGIGAETKQAPASENLGAGDWVNFWDDAGTTKVRKADASTAGKEADGFVLAAVTAGNNAIVYLEGINNQESGLTGGSRYYLSATTAGAATDTPPSGTGKVVQYLGKALSATEISFEGDEGTILA